MSIIFFIVFSLICTLIYTDIIAEERRIEAIFDELIKLKHEIDCEVNTISNTHSTNNQQSFMPPPFGHIVTAQAMYWHGKNVYDMYTPNNNNNKYPQTSSSIHRIKCEYCESHVPADKINCPNCGAPLKMY